MEWTFTAPVLSLGKNYRFKSLKNKHYESIIKYCTSKDHLGLIDYMQQLLANLCTDKSLNIPELPVIDQFFLMVRVRSICIGTRIELVFSDQEDENIKHTAMLSQIQKSINRSYIEPEMIGSQDLGVVVHYTNQWDDPDEISFIKSIFIDGDEITVNNMSPEQAKQIISTLPLDINKKIKHTISQLVGSIHKMQFLQLPGDQPDICLDPNDYSYYISTLYDGSIPNFIEEMYVFVKFLNMSLSDVMNLTPSDTKIYYQMFVKEMQEKEKVQKQSKQRKGDSRDMPLKF